ncbi:MAG: alpha/beta hydrolase [Gammaproteobacteria bacterium]|nr:alpha/beta hydrolase [Gammaproteobacteria bacterium]
MTAVVYVHGLWMPGEESLVLKSRLAHDYALELHAFRYSAVGSGMSQITERLAEYVQSLASPEVHFIGHSLGGLVIYRLLERFPDQPPGRVVFLGTPSVASRAAEHAARFAPIAHLMGQSVAEELLQAHERRWTQARPLGIVAGSQRIGLGQLLAHFEEDNDGTVAVSETRMAGASDHIVLPVSHLGMLLSTRVAEETGRFLTRGHFSLR